MFGSRSWNPYGRLFCSPEDDAGGGNDKPGEAKPDDPLAGLTDAQKSAIQKQIDSAAATARRDAEKTARTRFETEAEAKKRTEDEERQRQKDIEAGEFTKVKTSLESERDTFKTAAERTAAELEEAQAELAAVIAERVQTLEASGDKDLIAAFPKDDKPLAQLRWLNDPRTKAALKTATDAKKVEDAKNGPRVPGTPKPNGAVKEPVKSLVNTRSF